MKFKLFNKENDYKFLKKIGIGLVLVAAILIIKDEILWNLGFYDDVSSSSEVSLNDEVDEDCSVVAIEVHGNIMTYIPEHSQDDLYLNDSVASESIVWSIKDANEDENIKAILIEVDSSGGYPVAGEEIANAIKNSEKPVFGLIRQTGASAAYWAISPADKIWASKNSDIGGIGVTMSYLNNAENNKKEGYTYEQLSSGKFKDSGSADKPLTNEERELFMRDVNIIHQNFMEAVSQNRNIPMEKVKSFADGSTVLGDKAKELGLIDEIGGMSEIEKYLEETIGEKPEICW